MDEFNVTAVIWQEDDVLVSKCPELEVASAGDTPQEALENLKEAVELYIGNGKALGIFDIPSLAAVCFNKISTKLNL